MSDNNEISRDIFDFHGECLEKLDTPEFWEEIFWPGVGVLLQKHKHNLFHNGLIPALYDDVNRKWKATRS